MNMIITIGREFGSGGRELGRRLAENLGIAYYDQEIVTEIAKRTELSERYIQQIISRRPITSYPITTVHSFHPVSNPLMEQSCTVFQEQCSILQEMAEKSDCVIVGRCADYILREHANCMNVFVHANKEDRIRRSVAKKDCEERKAADFVTKKDKQRANYYNFYSNKRWDDLQNYDITIDTSRFSLDEAVELLIDAARRLDR